MSSAKTTSSGFTTSFSKTSSKTFSARSCLPAATHAPRQVVAANRSGSMPSRPRPTRRSTALAAALRRRQSTSLRVRRGGSPPPGSGGRPSPPPRRAIEHRAGGGAAPARGRDAREAGGDERARTVAGRRTRLAARRVASRATHADIARGGDESQASADVDGLSETTFREGEAASSRARRGDVHDRARQKWREDARDGRFVSSRARDVRAEATARARRRGGFSLFGALFRKSVNGACVGGGPPGARRRHAQVIQRGLYQVQQLLVGGPFLVGRSAVRDAPPPRVALDAHARRLRRDRRPPPSPPPSPSRASRGRRADLPPPSRGARSYPWRRPPRRCRRRPPPGAADAPSTLRVPRPRRPRGRRVHGRGRRFASWLAAEARARVLSDPARPSARTREPSGRITPRPSTPLDASRAAATDAYRAHPASARVERAGAAPRAPPRRRRRHRGVPPDARPGGTRRRGTPKPKPLTRRKLDATRAHRPRGGGGGGCARDDAAPAPSRLSTNRRSARLGARRDGRGARGTRRGGRDAPRGGEERPERGSGRGTSRRG